MFLSLILLLKSKGSESCGPGLEWALPPQEIGLSSRGVQEAGRGPSEELGLCLASASSPLSHCHRFGPAPTFCTWIIAKGSQKPCLVLRSFPGQPVLQNL